MILWLACRMRLALQVHSVLFALHSTAYLRHMDVMLKLNMADNLQTQVCESLAIEG